MVASMFGGRPSYWMQHIYSILILMIHKHVVGVVRVAKEERKE
jgi:hypothetical protein